MEDRLEEGRNGLLQSKYFIISCRKTDFDSAKTYFNTVEFSIQQLFHRLGSGLIPLNAKERLRALHSFYRMGEEEEFSGIGLKALFIQGVATSIDALSVGFTIANYDWLMALVCSVIIAVVTFFICMTGLSLGKRFGTRLSNKADILGGVILIAIGLEIFISNVL